MLTRSGRRFHFAITDQITKLQSDNGRKLICLQRVEFEDGRKELRLAYYIIGKKPRMRNKWVWGQYATFMPPRDFRVIVRQAQKKGWI